MNNRKAFFLPFLVILSLMLSLSACSKTEQAATPAQENPQEATPVTIGEEVFVPDEEEYIFTLNYDKEIFNGEGDFVVLRYSDSGIYATLSDSEGDKLVLIDGGNNLTVLQDFVPAYETLSSATDGYAVFLDVSESQNLVTLENAYGYTENKDGSYSYNAYFFLRVLDANGKELKSTRLKNISSVSTIGGALLVDDDTILICDGTACFAYDFDGNVEYEVSEKKNSVAGLVETRDGNAAVLLTGKDGNTLRVLNSNPELEVAMPTGLYPEDLVTGAGYYDVCYTLGSTFYGLNLTDERTDALFNWINSGIVSDEVQAVRANADGTASAIKYDYSYYHDSASVNTVSVTKVPASTDPRTVVPVASVYADYNLWYQIIDFNLTNQFFRAELVDYSTYNTDADPETAYKNLLSDMKAGAAPDVIYSGQLDDAQFEAVGKEGYFVDLYPKIDDDIALSRRDYNLEAFRAGEIDGQLFAVVPNFTVTSFVGISNVIGPVDSWNADTAKAALSSCNEGASIEYEPEQGDAFKEDTQSLRDGDCLIYKGKFESLYDVASAINLVGSDISFVPAPDGTGLKINGNRTFSISSSAQNPDVAWSFVSYFLTEDYQVNFSQRFPANVHALKKYAANEAADAADMYFDEPELITSEVLLEKLEQLIK